MALVVLVILRVTKLIDWSWWWVLSPLWAVLLLWTLTVFAGKLADRAVENERQKRRDKEDAIKFKYLDGQ